VPSFGPAPLSLERARGLDLGLESSFPTRVAGGACERLR
jgi:hypothetical protein